MANRRMFSLDIVASDAFLEMPTSSRELYFHLGMYADDDGFVSPKKIMRMVGASDDDLKVLLGKRFLLLFESGVVVVKHWKMNNYLQKDRYKPTAYTEEMALLTTKDNDSYTLCIQNVNTGKDSIGKVSIGKERKHFVPPSLNELSEFISNNGYDVNPDTFFNFYESNGWKVGINPMKSWKAAVAQWSSRNKPKLNKYELLGKISGKTKLFWNGISLSWFKSALNECYPDNMNFLQGQQAEDFKKVVDNYQEVIKFYENN